VSHASTTLQDLCTRAVWLDHGRIVDDGPIPRVLDAYKAAMSPQAAFVGQASACGGLQSASASGGIPVAR